MPNNSYLRSRRREQQTVNQLRKDGWIAARSAGSRSKVDVWAYHPVTRQFRMIQIKTKKGARGFVEQVMWMHSDVTARFIWNSYE